MATNPETREYFLRHAQSQANILQILISDPEIGIHMYGITEEGKIQVRTSISEAKENGLGKNRKVVFVCSPFKRAVETAEEALSLVGGVIVIDERLSERWMGEFDQQSDKTLDIIWQGDSEDNNNKANDVESPHEVAARMVAVFQDAQDSFPGCDIVYVSHGDPIQIAITTRRQLLPGEHRKLPHMQNAEIRRFG